MASAQVTAPATVSATAQALELAGVWTVGLLTKQPRRLKALAGVRPIVPATVQGTALAGRQAATSAVMQAMRLAGAQATKQTAAQVQSEAQLRR